MAAGVRRSVKLPWTKEEKEEMGPWLSKPFSGTLRLTDTPEPYTWNGYICREGWFFKCGAYRHAKWATDHGLIEGSLDDWGWIKVWNFLGHRKNIDWNTDIELTRQQIDTVLMWCMHKNIPLKDALGWRFEFFDK